LKKVILSILAVFYLSSSIGATIHLHYCMDKFVGWGFDAPDDKECSSCGMEKGVENGCCKEDSKKIKLETDQKVAEYFVFSFHHDLHESILYFAGTNGSPLISNAHKLPRSKAPPVSDKSSLYLLHRAIRI
jgi:hypothetical protein